MKRGSPSVVDTNILLVANQQHTGVSDACVVACVEVLLRLRERGRVVIDDGYEILNEYARKTSPNTGNRVGDAFLKWLYQNAANTVRVETVQIEREPNRGYVQFPDDSDLHEFDRADRKFVAVSVAHPDRPSILQGTDSKWLKWSERLSSHGIDVEFLCPKDVARFAGG